MKTITPAQCRAARSLLDINRETLSDKSGIPIGTIGQFENGKVNTRLQVVSNLRLSLEVAGVDFIDDDGVRLHQDKIRVFKGEKAHRQLLDEIFNDLKDTGGEILLKGVVESRWSDGDDKAFLSHHLDRLVAAGITERILVRENDEVIDKYRHWYRTIEPEYFTPMTQWIFGGKVAFITWGDIEFVTVIEGRDLYQSALKDFNCIWDNVAKVLD